MSDETINSEELNEIFPEFVTGLVLDASQGMAKDEHLREASAVCLSALEKSAQRGGLAFNRDYILGAIAGAAILGQAMESIPSPVFAIAGEMAWKHAAALSGALALYIQNKEVK